MQLHKKLLLIALIFSLKGIAQEIDGKNIVKVNLSAVAFKGFHLQYERQVSQKVTVAFGYGMIPFSAIPYKSYIKKEVFIPNVNLSDYRAGTYIFTPEVRYYFGKKGAFHGFYLAPYARIGFYKVDGPIEYSNTSQQDKDADFSGKLTAITGGLMVGSSWQLSDKFYLDVWIAGAGFGGESGRFTTAEQLSEAEQTSLRRNLNSISLSGVKLTSEVNSDGAVVKTSGSIAGVRGLGLTFGIRF